MAVANENPYKDPRTDGPPNSDRASYGRIWPTAVIALLLFFVAAQRIWMPFGAAVLLVPVQAVLLLFTLFFRRGHKNALRMRIARIGVYALTLMVAFGVALLEERLIRNQAQELVVACEAFSRDKGRLPNALSELAPDYRPSIPTSLGEFLFLRGATYFYAPPDERNAARFLYRLNPDASRTYSFETHQWTPP